MKPMTIKQNPIQHFKQTIDSPTLVLIDMAFLSSEFRSYREYYADLYSGSRPNYPAKSLPTRMSESLLIDALCKYIRLIKNSSDFILFQQQTDKEVIDDTSGRLMKRIKCNKPTYHEMNDVIKSVPETKRVVIMADDLEYVSLIEMLLNQGYAIGLIKHMHRGDTDESQMPPDLAYQFSLYVILESLGLKEHEF